MAKAISVRQKKRGRPKTGVTPAISLRLPSESQKAVEAWAKRQPDNPSLSEAIRRMIEIALKSGRD
jgi:hypothetical protein